MIALLLTVLLFASLIGPQHDDLRVREAHHGYWGILLAGIGYGFGWPVLYWGGVLLLADDVWQHGVQRWLNPAYRSPVHRLYALFYRIPWVRRLNDWVDGR